MTTTTTAAIAGWLVSGAAGAGLLGWAAWRLSVWAWEHRPPKNIAPRVHLPSLHELRARHRR